MTTIPLIGAEVPLDEISQCATPTQDGHDESVQQAISSRREDIHTYKFSPTAPLQVQQAGEEWDDYAQRFIFSLLIRQGLRVLKNHPDWSEVEIADLAEQLAEYYEHALRRLDPEARLTSAYEARTGGGKTPAYLDAVQAERQAQKAAEVAFEYFDPSWSSKQREWSRKGGKKKSYNYADHVATEHLSVAAAARALGRARGTIYAMRAEYEEKNDPEHSEAEVVRSILGSEDELAPVAVVDDEHGAGTGTHIDAPRSEGRVLRLDEL